MAETSIIGAIMEALKSRSLAKASDAYAPGYRQADKKMKVQIEAEMKPKESYASMKDTPYDKAQAFATSLKFHQMFPNTSDLETNLAGAAHEAASGAKAYAEGSGRFGLMDYIDDYNRDRENNRAADAFWEWMKKENDVTPELTDEQIIELGKLYGTNQWSPPK